MEKISSYSKQYFVKERNRFHLHVFLSIVSFSCLIITPLVGSWLIDVLANADSFTMLLRPGICTLLINVISIIVSYVSALNMVKMLSRCQYSAISDAITHIQKVPLGAINSSFDAAYLTPRITSDINAVINFSCEHCVQKYLYACSIIIIGLIMCFINPLLLFMCVLFSGVYAGAYLFFKTPIAEAAEKNKETTAVFHKALFNRLKHWKVVKINVLFEEDAAYSEKYFRNYRNMLLLYNSIIQKFSSSERTVSIVFQAIILFVGGIQIINKNMTVGQYLAINTYFSFYIKSIKYYFNFGKACQDARVSHRRILELYSIKEEDNGVSAPRNISQVQINNLEFSFHINDCKLFNQLNLKFQRHGLWVLKGENGAGKTTLINIMIGIIKPDNENAVEVNKQINIDWYSLRKRNISVLLQDEDRTDMTVDDYFLFYHGESLDSIAKKAVDPFLKKMFFDSDFNLLKIRDQPIVHTSGGEWQRIRLLRALIKDADIYFLDEPTNNLDQNTIVTLKKFIGVLKEKKIILISSHDCLFDSYANEVIQLEKIC